MAWRMPARLLLRPESAPSVNGLTEKKESLSEGMSDSRKLAMILKSVRMVPITALRIMPSAEPMGWLATTMKGPSCGM